VREKLIFWIPLFTLFSLWADADDILNILATSQIVISLFSRTSLYWVNIFMCLACWWMFWVFGTLSKDTLLLNHSKTCSYIIWIWCWHAVLLSLWFFRYARIANGAYFTVSFFIDLIFPAWKSPQPLITEMSTRGCLLGGKGCLCIGLTTLPFSCADCLEIVGASTSCSPKGPSWTLMG